MEMLREIERRAVAGSNTGQADEMVLALASIVGLSKRAQHELKQAQGPALAMTPLSQSSVQIETRQRGAPAFTVKAYAETVDMASELASAAYDRLMRRYAEAARVTAEEAVP